MNMSLKQTKERVIRFLLATKGFKDDIGYLRTVWNIDCTKQGKIINKWSDTWGKLAREYFFKNGVSEAKLTIPYLKRALDTEIFKLIKKYGLDQYFYEFIFTYLTANEVVYGDEKLKVEVTNDKFSTISIPLSVYADLEDLKEIMAWTKKKIAPHVLYNFLKAPNKVKNFDMKLRIFELKEMGKQSPEVKLIILSEFGKNLPYDKINKIYSSWKR